MKPKDLKAPFLWHARCPLIHDGVFFVPQYFQEHAQFTFPGWEDEQVFGTRKPVRLEYCSGNGLWLSRCAERDPSSHWVGVEQRFDRVRKIWAKRKNLSLKNLFVVCGEGYTFSRWYVPAQSVEEVFINFPDPWPKKRHHKHRLIQPAFVGELSRILKSGGRFTFVTDDPAYRDHTIEMIGSDERFTNLHHPTPFATEKEGYGTSYFEALWREKGKKIYYLEYQKS